MPRPISFFMEMAIQDQSWVHNDTDHDQGIAGSLLMDSQNICINMYKPYPSHTLVLYNIPSIINNHQYPLLIPTTSQYQYESLTITIIVQYPFNCTLYILTIATPKKRTKLYIWSFFCQGGHRVCPKCGDMSYPILETLLYLWEGY